MQHRYMCTQETVQDSFKQIKRKQEKLQMQHRYICRQETVQDGFKTSKTKVETTV